MRARQAWPVAEEATETGEAVAGKEADDLDFERLDVLLGALLDRNWPGVAGFADDASTGEAIAHYVAGLREDDKELLLRSYLLLEVMLDEADEPGVANVVSNRLPQLAEPAN